MDLVSYHPDRDSYQKHAPLGKETFKTIFISSDSMDLYIANIDGTKICDIFGTQKSEIEIGLLSEIQGVPLYFDNDIYMSLQNGEIWSFTTEGFKKLLENK